MYGDLGIWGSEHGIPLYSLCRWATRYTGKRRVTPPACRSGVTSSLPSCAHSTSDSASRHIECWDDKYHMFCRRPLAILAHTKPPHPSPSTRLATASSWRKQIVVCAAWPHGFTLSHIGFQKNLLFPNYQWIPVELVYISTKTIIDLNLAGQLDCR
jgi:hypothetical protein